MTQKKKAELRKTLCARRRSLSVQKRQEASMAILSDQILAFFLQLQQQYGYQLGGYWPLPTEFDSRPLLSSLQEKGFSLSLPVMINREQMIFRAFDFLHDHDSLQKDVMNIMGPSADKEDVIPDVLLLPLCGFDQQGERLGYGSGCYDRYLQSRLARGEKPYLLGLAFSCQEVDKIITEAHDCRLDGILTERGLCFFNADSSIA